MGTKESLAACVAVLLSAGAAGADVTRGPYLQANSTDSAIVVVELDAPGEVEVRYGDGQVARSGGAATHHEIELSGLSPDTRYDYAVYQDGTELSGGHALWTAVEPGSPFSFALYGDTRTQPNVHAEIVTAIAAEAPHMMVHTGDLVADGEVAEQWDEFFTIEQPLLSQVPLFPAVGNHDEHQQDAVLFRAAFALPETETYYSFDYGSAHFVMIDGHVEIEPACRIGDQAVIGCLNQDQMSFLEADLTAAVQNPDIDHIFVVTHIGPFTSVDSRDGSMQMRALMPMFADYGVTAVLSGHDHYYQRGEDPSGVPYIISGGSGAPLYEIAEPNPAPHTVLAEDEAHHYVWIDIAGDTAEVTAKALDGTVLDTVVLQAREPNCEVVDCDGTGTDPDPGSGSDPGESGGCAAGGGLGAGALAVLAAFVLVRRRQIA